MHRLQEYFGTKYKFTEDGEYYIFPLNNNTFLRIKFKIDDIINVEIKRDGKIIFTNEIDIDKDFPYLMSLVFYFGKE